MIPFPCTSFPSPVSHNTKVVRARDRNLHIGRLTEPNRVAQQWPNPPQAHFKKAHPPPSPPKKHQDDARCAPSQDISIAAIAGLGLCRLSWNDTPSSMASAMASSPSQFLLLLFSVVVATRNIPCCQGSSDGGVPCSQLHATALVVTAARMVCPMEDGCPAIH